MRGYALGRINYEKIVTILYINSEDNIRQTNVFIENYDIPEGNLFKLIYICYAIRIKTIYGHGLQIWFDEWFFSKQPIAWRVRWKFD